MRYIFLFFLACVLFSAWPRRSYRNLCLLARTAQTLADDMLQICERHLEQARQDVRAAPEAAPSINAQAAPSINTRTQNKMWADVPHDATPSDFWNLSSAEADMGNSTEECGQSASVGRGDLLGTLNVFQSFVCRKILLDEPFLVAEGYFVRDEHGDALERPAEDVPRERLVVSVSTVPGSFQDLVEGIVLARASCQHYVGRNVFLQEEEQRAVQPKEAEKEVEPWKDRTTFFVSQVKHFQKGFLWPHVQECTSLEKTHSNIMAALTNASGLALREDMTQADLEAWLTERIDLEAEGNVGVLFTNVRQGGAPERIAAEERDRQGGDMLGYKKKRPRAQRGHDFERHVHRSCTATGSHRSWFVILFCVFFLHFPFCLW